MAAEAVSGDQRVSSVMHVRCPDRLPEDVFRQVLELLAEFSPVVQALPPSAALVELKGALRYHGTGARRLGEVLRVRTLSRLGVDVRVGIGPTITVAATASGQIDAPGGVLAIDPDQVADWLGPLPVEALHGIGPKQAAALREYGVHCVGLLAAVPPATVQRLLGGRAGRMAADRARGIDPRPVAPRALPATLTVRHAFAQHTLDGALVRAALLDLVVQLAHQLRQPRPGGPRPDLGTAVRRRGLVGEDAPSAGGLGARRRLAHPGVSHRRCRGPAARPPDRAGPQGRGPGRRGSGGPADQPGPGARGPAGR